MSRRSEGAVESSANGSVPDGSVSNSSAPDGSAPVEQAGKSIETVYRTVVTAMVAVISLVAFEALAVSTAMPVIARELNGVRSYGLAFSLFLTMSMLGTVLAGGWCDKQGPRWPVVSGLGLFTLGLVVSGIANDFNTMLLGRVVSGIGGGFLIVSLYVVVAMVFPKERQPAVFGWFSAAWVVPSLVGPPVAGWLAEDVSWRWVFLAVPPLLVLVSALLLPQVWSVAGHEPDGADRRDGGRRALAGLGLAVGAAALQWGAQEIVPPSPLPVLAIVAGLIAVVVCLPRLLPPGTLRAARGLPSVIAVRGLLAGSFFGAETFVPLMLVNERKLTPAVAGIVLTVGSLGWFAGSWLQGRPGFRIPRHRLLSGGGVFVTVGVALLPLGVLPLLPAFVAMPIWVIAGFGMGLALSTTSVLTLSLSAPREEGRNSASLQLSDALGSVIGIGGAGAVFAAMHTEPGQDGDVFTLIWLALAVLGVAAAFVGHRGRPASASAAGPVSLPAS